MILIIGGYAQGKLEYVRKNYQFNTVCVYDGILPQQPETVPVINHFHRWVAACLKSGQSPEEEIHRWLASHPDAVIICDQVGNGIVPVDAFERDYRQRLGRILVDIAAQAGEVVRVICGLGQKIK